MRDVKMFEETKLVDCPTCGHAGHRVKVHPPRCLVSEVDSDVLDGTTSVHFEPDPRTGIIRTHVEAGSEISHAIGEAIQLATSENRSVMFIFNGTEVVIGPGASFQEALGSWASNRYKQVNGAARTP